MGEFDHPIFAREYMQVPPPLPVPPPIPPTVVRAELGDVLVFTVRDMPLSREQLRLFQREIKHYFPNNEVLVLNGDIDVTVVRSEDWKDMEVK